MARVGTVVVDVEVGANASKFLSDMDSAARRAGASVTGALGRTARTVVSDLGSSAKSATLLIGGIGVMASKVSTDFNKSMSGVGAVANATAGELGLLREAALEAGAATSFSASEAAVAEAELARAGVGVADILDGALMGSLDLAAAGQLELGKAAEISAQALNIFNLEGSQTGHVADVLAAGANKSAADVGQLGDALRQGGLVASQYNLGIETTVGVLSAFADRALIGSDAGTSFKTMLQRLVPASGPAKEAMDRIGFSAFDATGNFVGLESVAQQLQDGLAGLSDEQRSAALTTIFGSDAVRAATVLYELGADGVRDYTTAVDDQGAAARMAATQLDNLAGDVEEFSGSIETALIRTGDLGQVALRELVQGGTDVVNVFNDFAASDSWDRIEDRLGGFLASGDLAAGVADRIGDALDRIDPSDIDRAFDRLEQLRSSASGLMDDFGALTGLTAGIGTSIVTMGLRSIPVLGAFAPAISPITGALGGLLLSTDEGREGLSQLGGSLKDIAREAGPEVLESLGLVADEIGGSLGEAIGIVAPELADAAIRILPLFADALADIAPAAGEFLVAGADLTAEVLPELVSLLEAGVPVLGLLNPALELGADAMGLLADNAEILVPLLAGLGAVKLAGVVRDLGLLGRVSGPLNSVLQPLAQLRSDFVNLSTGQALRNFGGGIGQSLRSITTGAPGAMLALGGLVTAGSMYNSMMQDAQRQGEEFGQSLRSSFDPAVATYAELTSASAELSDKSRQLRADIDDSFVGRNTYNKDYNEALKTGAAEADKFRAEIDAMTSSADRLSGQIGTTRNQSLNLLREQERLGEAFGTNAGLADTFRRELDQLVGGKLSALDATVAYEQAVDDLSTSLDLNGASFDAATQEGRNNLNAVRDNVVAAHELAAAMIEESGDVDGARQKLLEHAAGLQDVFRDAGLTEDQIRDLNETYGLTPDLIETAVRQVGAQKAAAEVVHLQDRLNGLPDIVSSYIQALIDRGKLDEAERALNNLGRPRRVDFIPVGPGVAGGPIRAPQAHGSVLDFFAAGGFKENHVAQIAPAGAWRVWAEPETGGEAYIPLAPSKRDRSLDIWEETGRRLGASAGGVVVQLAAGAIVVHAAPGMDEQALAEAVYRQFAERARGDHGFLSAIGAAA